MKRIIPIIFLIIIFINCSAQMNKSLADKWQFIGTAVEEPGFTIWGSSPIIGPDGKTHLFVARWPGTTVEPGWRSDSEIAQPVIY